MVVGFVLWWTLINIISIICLRKQYKKLGPHPDPNKGMAYVYSYEDMRFTLTVLTTILIISCAMELGLFISIGATIVGCP